MFITFEGIEGSGKGTAIERIQQWLEESGRSVFLTREPGGSELGRGLRAFLLDARQKIEPEAELFLYLADRAQHVRQVIAPALKRGELVISDRYADSTIVYQGYGRGLNLDKLYEMNRMAVDDLWPDLTILLDVAPEIGLERARTRNKALGLDVLEGRFEAESLAFHQRIRDGYLAWAEKKQDRFRVIDGGARPEEVFNEVRATISRSLAGACPGNLLPRTRLRRSKRWRAVRREARRTLAGALRMPAVKAAAHRACNSLLRL